MAYEDNFLRGTILVGLPARSRPASHAAIVPRSNLRSRPSFTCGIYPVWVHSYTVARFTLSHWQSSESVRYSGVSIGISPSGHRSASSRVLESGSRDSPDSPNSSFSPEREYRL